MKDKLKEEIIQQLHDIENIICYHQEDKEIEKIVCRNLRKIHNRLDKLTNKNKTNKNLPSV